MGLTETNNTPRCTTFGLEISYQKTLLNTHVLLIDLLIVSNTTAELSPITPGLGYLIASTASVSFAFSESWTFIPFLRDDIPPQSLVNFWDSFLYQTNPGWLDFGMTSAIAGYLSHQYSSGLSRRLYGWGVFFALSHYAFGYIEVSQVIEKIAHGPLEEVKDMQRYWLKIHTARTLCSDIPAMICFIAAFLHLGVM